MGSNFFKSYYEWINPEYKQQYDPIRRNVSDIYSTWENIFQDSSQKVFKFTSKLGAWSWWVFNVLIKFLWFMMNHEYLFEIILILIILWIITKISKNILPPIVYVYERLVNIQRPRRRNIRY